MSKKDIEKNIKWLEFWIQEFKEALNTNTISTVYIYSEDIFLQAKKLDEAVLKFIK
jgi:hypothetical protein